MSREQVELGFLETPPAASAAAAPAAPAAELSYLHVEYSPLTKSMTRDPAKRISRRGKDVVFEAKFLQYCSVVANNCGFNEFQRPAPHAACISLGCATNQGLDGHVTLCYWPDRDYSGAEKRTAMYE
jgi:hypothetical protein